MMIIMIIMGVKMGNFYYKLFIVRVANLEAPLNSLKSKAIQ